MSTLNQPGVQAWLASRLASTCGLAAENVDVRAPMSQLGLDSVKAVGLIAALSEHIGRELSPTLAWEQPTIEALAAHVCGEESGPKPAASSVETARARDDAEPIAIVGMAGRFPGAPDLASFWRLLEGGVDAVSEVPAARGWDAYFAAAGIEPEERDRARRGAFLERLDEFDPLFFGISPREATSMDPQQRLMLELCWEALEDAGIPPGSLRGTNTGVFAGAIWSDYASLLYRGGPGGLDQYTVTGSHHSIIANRISYLLGLQGPSLTLDSACSSGLVVAHLASDSLRRGESRVALAGAVNLNILPESAIGVSRFGALSQDGHCYTFDARANGYARGEGGVVIVLKTLSRAIADGDPIHAVIRGSAVNNDGASNGLTAPNRAAQEAVLREAYARAGVALSAVQYVEAHGTGTPLGDPIEARALGAVLGTGRPAEAPLLIGSVKTNVGHLEGAAGLAGLAKTVLAIERRRLPASLNFESPNPRAPLAEMGLAVPTAARPWPSPEQPLTAGVSSFGLGGTNSHVVLQEWPGAVRPSHPGSVSATSQAAGARDRGVVFVFPGQGAQWPGMALSLIHGEPVFRATLEACDGHIRRFMGWSLLEQLAAPRGASRLDDIEVSLPAIISLDIAVSAWWRTRGVEPAAVVGHSTGEIAAAYVAGALDLEDTMRVICAYGRFVGRFSGRGGMALLGVPWDEAERALAGFEDRVFRAIQDSAEGTVVAGEPAAIAELAAVLKARGVFCRPVAMNVGPHSPLVDSVREELFEALQGIRPRATRIPLVSEVTGDEIPGTSLDAAHWVRNFGDPAFFSRAIDTLIGRGHRVFVDVGPHPITRHSVETNLRRAGCGPESADAGCVLASLRRDEDGRGTLAATLATLQARGLAAPADAAVRPAELFVLSAKSEAAVSAQAARLREHLERHPDLALGDVAYSLATTRSALDHRCAVSAASREALLEALGAAAEGPSPAGVARGTAGVSRGKRAFLFTGQGAQKLGMGRALYDAWPAFRDALDACTALFDTERARPLREAMWAAPGSPEAELLDQTETTQPALFAFEYALCALLRSWGVEPDLVAGHSIGEIVAACVAGVFSLEDAVKLVSARGRLMQALPAGGAMVSIEAPETDVAAAVAPHAAQVSIAAVNAPSQVVVAGAEAPVLAIASSFAARGARTKRLIVSHAFHSPLMEPMLEAFRSVAAGVTYKAPARPVVSNLTGKLAGPEIAAADYWVRHVREAVRFGDGARALAEAGASTFVEIGPRSVLLAMVSASLPGAAHALVAAVRAHRDEPASVLEALGALWVKGHEIRWSAVFPGGGRRVPLPSYPWQRERYWVDVPADAARTEEPTGHPLLGWRMSAAGEGAAFEAVVSLERHPWLADHRIAERVIVPSAAVVELVRAAAELHAGTHAVRVTGLVLQAPVLVPETGELRIRVALEETADGAWAAEVSSQPADAWSLHATATVGPTPAEASTAVLDLEAVRARCAEAKDVGEAWSALAKVGIEYGPAFRGLRALWCGDGAALGELTLPAGVAAAGYGLHPVLLDAGFQTLSALMPGLAAGEPLMPFEIGGFVVHAAGAAAAAWAFARWHEGAGGAVDVTLADATGAVVAEMTGVRLRRAAPGALRAPSAGPSVRRAPVRKKPARPVATAQGEWAIRLAALPPERREDEVQKAVQADVARVLALRSASAVPLDRPISELGMDSFMAVQLRNALEARVGKSLSATLAFDYPTVQAITGLLLEKVLVVTARAEERAPAAAKADLDEPIAIVGMSCRLPGGVTDPQGLWRLLDAGVDATAEMPGERWDVDALYDPDPGATGKMSSRRGGFLADVDRFEPAFFGISPREAMAMDPQQRLLLETSWEALEGAGIVPQRLMGSDTGVFVGMTFHDYAAFGPGLKGLDGYVGTGTAACMASGRISYTLGLKGPSLTVDTACSSSLVTVHLASQSLRQGECRLALAGGVTLTLIPDLFVEFSRLRGLAPDGRCKTFSAAADGAAWSEGCVMLALKRLSDAERDGDPVLAVIRGSAVNQDGRSNGITAPNGPSQEAVIRRALAQAGLTPGQLDYVECHGTGTALGDPIEVQALSAVMAEERPLDNPVWIGSVKSNLAHGQDAAGATGIMKIVLAMQNERIPKNLHFDAPSPHIPWSELPVKVVAEPVPWHRNGSPRRAGVSSFGISGTNAHVVLEEAPARATAPAALPRSAELVVLSAKTEAALNAQAARLKDHLDADPALALGDLAYSLLTTRGTLEHRVAFAASDSAALKDVLAELAAGRTPDGVTRARGDGTGRPRVYFVFPGQGSQWLGMGRQLLQQEPAFRTALEACDAAIRKDSGWSVLAELQADEATSQLGRIDVVQPVLFAIEVALAALWRSWGVQPDGVLGHSMGETAAACVAGALSLEDAVRVICGRSRLLRRISGQGEMAVVELTVAEAEAALRGREDRLSVAVSNGPRSTVLSGDPAALAEVLSSLEARGVFCRRVKVDVASHSPQVEPLREELLAALGEVRGREAEVPMYSTVSGAELRGPELAASYWMDNLRLPVRFGDTVQALLEAGPCVFVEMSPHPLLTLAVEEIRQAGGHKGGAVASLRRGREERRTLLESLGALWTLGLPLTAGRVFPGGGRRVALPTYAWQRERYWWLETPGAGTRAAPVRAQTGGHPLLGPGRAVSAQAGMRLWETTLDPQRLPWLRDHRVRGNMVFPGTGYLEMALAAGIAALGGGPVAVERVELVEALIIPEDAVVEVQVVTTGGAAGPLSFQVASRAPGAAETAWTVHARGSLRRAEPSPSAPRDTHEVRGTRGEPSPTSALYAAMEGMGLTYGPAFRGIRELWRSEGAALSQVQLPEAAGAAADYQIHPALLDACFQTVAGVLGGTDGATWLPVEVGAYRLFRRPAGALLCHVRAVPHAPGGSRRSADVVVVDAAGAEVAAITGLVAQRVAAESGHRPEDDWFLDLSWEVVPVPAAKHTSGRWLILGAGDGLGASLRAALEAQGHHVVQAVRGAPGRVPAGCVPVDDTSEAGVRALLGSAFGGKAASAVVHLGSLQAPHELHAEEILAAQGSGYESVLCTVQALGGMGYRDAPRLWLLTRGAQAAGAGRIDVAQAPVLGLGRTIGMEYPELRCTRVDLDPSRPAGEVEALLDELQGNKAEQEVALRGSQRRVARLVHTRPENAPTERTEPAGDRPFHLTIDKPGVLDGLLLRAGDRRAPGPGEVEIAVEAAGLNFIDVMKAMGIYPGAGDGPPALGGEIAGRITRVGEGVCGFQPGDEVMAFAPAGFSTHVCADAGRVARRPAGMSPAQASSVPIVFMTAWYGLVHLARIQPGDRVLIHSATGGTGLAAIQIARHFGAEVFATAGSEEKRAWLREQRIAHVMDSRSLEFAGQVLAATDGQGVDVVLNSLSGGAIEASLSALGIDGRFIELGKTDIYADRPLGLAHFKKSLSYSAVDLAGLAVRRPARFDALFHEVVALFERGTLTPLPTETFSVARAADAFRKMAQGRHIGKLVLTFADPGVPIQVPVKPRNAPLGTGTYLITGGLGGLGLSIAGWLAEKGAGHLVLLGRSGAASKDQQAAVAALAARGTKVTVARADVASRAQLQRVLAEIPAETPLRGIFHTAGILDDGLLTQQTPARFRAVMAPKALGAWHLHALTRDLPLDFFILYSSMSGILGSPGQGNYAAANAFLDALAHDRRAQGLPALSLDWGAFSEVGLAAAQDNRAARLASQGIRSITPKEGLVALDRWFSASSAQAAIVPLDARQWVESYPAAASSSLLASLLAEKPGASRAGGASELAARIADATPPARIALVQSFLRSEASRVLRIPEDKLDQSAPLTGLGMDSLMGLELRNRVEASLGLRMPATLLWTYPTISALAGHLAEQMAPPAEAPVEQLPEPVAAPVQEGVQSEDDPLDDEDLFALVQDSLSRASREDVTL